MYAKQRMLTVNSIILLSTSWARRALTQGPGPERTPNKVNDQVDSGILSPNGSPKKVDDHFLLLGRPRGI